jgi:adhesin transport system membrane fusion protein
MSALAAQVVDDQMAAYRARTQQREAELRVLRSEHEQRVYEINEQIARKRQLEQSLALAIEQLDIATPLMARRNFSRQEYLGLQTRVVQLQGDIETLAATIPKTQAVAQAAEDRIAFRKAELDTAITEEINKRRQELASLAENLAAGGDRVTRTEMRSPVRGTVKQIAITTVGGVVRPGESIMEIVPLDDTLLVEAKVRPQDVAFLLPGQRAMVKISAYDFSIYGGLEGQLEQISADTIEDRQGNFFYVVKVRTNATEIIYRDTALPIIPGMMATVDIMTGKKSILDYILKPIFKARQNALREK